MREHARLRRAAVTAVAGVIVLLLAPTASWADSDAEVTVSNTRVRVGEQIQVTGTGFTPGDQVTVAVCGAANASGRLACGTGVPDVVVAADGTLALPFTVHEPSGACPCTVVVDGPEGPPVTTRIELLGYAVAGKPKSPEVVVDSATVAPSRGLGHWFGLAPEPTLELVLRNAGASAAQPALDLAWRDGEGDPQPIVDSGIPVIEPGQTVTFSIPLNYGALAQGEHTVAGQVIVGDLFAPVEARSTVGPWGLYALVLAALVGGAVMRARRVAGPVRPATAARPARRAAPARVVPKPRVPARTERREQREPAYVGPPRLESTPLSPLTGRRSTQSMSPLERLGAAAPGRNAPKVTPPAATQAAPVVQRDPARDMATVAEALSAIAQRAGEAPARLPDPHEVPAQPGRRADRGGKRAARPAKGARAARR